HPARPALHQREGGDRPAGQRAGRGIGRDGLTPPHWTKTKRPSGRFFHGVTVASGRRYTTARSHHRSLAPLTPRPNAVFGRKVSIKQRREVLKPPYSRHASRDSKALRIEPDSLHAVSGRRQHVRLKCVTQHRDLINRDPHPGRHDAPELRRVLLET